MASSPGTSRFLPLAWAFVLCAALLVVVGLIAQLGADGSTGPSGWMRAYGLGGVAVFVALLLGLGGLCFVLARGPNRPGTVVLARAIWAILLGIVAFILLAPPSCSYLFLDGSKGSAGRAECETLVGLTLTPSGDASWMTLYAIGVPLGVAVLVFGALSLLRRPN
jgi:hypothetical protein